MVGVNNIIKLLITLRAPGPPLMMATHASDRGGTLIPGHRGGKRLTMMVIMFVGHLVLGDEPNIVSVLMLSGSKSLCLWIKELNVMLAIP